MISYLEGKLVHCEPAGIVIENNGIGYEIKVSLNTFGSIKELEKVKLHIHLHVNQMAQTFSGFSLYGFSDITEKKLFVELISVSGVGPSSAMMAISGYSAIDLIDAIVNENVKIIQSIKGVGPKTAQRIILELKEKLRKDKWVPNTGNNAVSSHYKIKDEAMSALQTLGIARNVAEKTLDTILKTDGQNYTVEQLIKIALKTV